MTSAAHEASFVLRPSAATAARGNTRIVEATIGGLFFVVVFLLFAVSSGMLARLGINHGGVTGAVLSKVHPATYLAFAAVALIIVARRNPASYFASLLT